MSPTQSILHKYFPSLSGRQAEQLELLEPLYREWNAKINVISRQDIDNILERHILYSLSISKIISFHPGTRILDAGTGGGFPGIPLAILFPETHFHLVDSTAKKLSVVREIAQATGLENVTTEHRRLEEHLPKYDFVVSRAVSTIPNMIRWVWKNVSPKHRNDLPNGILYLKGGDFAGELGGMEAGKRGSGEAGKHGGMEAWGHGGMEEGRKGPGYYHLYPLKEFFKEPFFETKSIIHLF